MEKNNLINEILEKSKSKLKNEFFKITSSSNNSFKIEQYFGLIKPNSKMLDEGWHRHTYLEKYLNEDYPIFDVHDFKSDDGIGIVKKDDKDILKEELLEYIEYMKMNKNIPDIIRSLKTIFKVFKVDFMKYDTFKNLNESVYNLIKNSSIVEKADLLMKYVNLINDFILNIESLNLDNTRTLINKKFKCFFILVE